MTVFLWLDLIGVVAVGAFLILYGLDASLRSYVPAWVAQYLMGVSGPEAEAAPMARRAPEPGRVSAS